MQFLLLGAEVQPLFIAAPEEIDQPVFLVQWVPRHKDAGRLLVVQAESKGALPEVLNLGARISITEIHLCSV